MEGRNVWARLVMLVCLVHLLSLVSADQGRLTRVLNNIGGNKRAKRWAPEGKVAQESADNTSKISTLIVKKLAVMAETTAVSIAISEAKNVKTSISNLRKTLVNTKSSTSGKVPSTEYGPYCKAIAIQGPVNIIMQRMFTAISNVARQLQNAVGTIAVKKNREELQCQMKEITKFVDAGSKNMKSDEVKGLLPTIDSTLKDVGNMQRGLEKRSPQLKKQLDEINTQIIDIRKKAKKSAKASKQHRRTQRKARGAPIGIHETKVNIFQEIDLKPGCC